MIKDQKCWGIKKAEFELCFFKMLTEVNKFLISKIKYMSNIIEIQVGDLKTHPQHSKIYSVDQDQLNALKEAIIRQSGIESPIIVTSDGEILDGVRRWMVAKMLGYKTVPCIIHDYTGEEEASVKIIDFNSQRIKTDTELYREVKLLETICDTQQGKRIDLTGEKPVNTRLEIAKKLDIKPSKVQKIKYVGDSTNGEFLLKQVDDGKASLSKAYDLAKEDMGATEKAPNANHQDKPTVQLDNIEVCTCEHCGSEYIKK